jgi:hypothetical protein
MGSVLREGLSKEERDVFRLEVDRRVDARADDGRNATPLHLI